MSQQIAEARLMRSQTQRFLAESRGPLIMTGKPGKLRAVNARKGLAVAQDPNGNSSLGQPLSNAVVTRKTDTSTLNNGSIDYKSATT